MFLSIVIFMYFFGQIDNIFGFDIAAHLSAASEISFVFSMYTKFCTCSSAHRSRAVLDTRYLIRDVNVEWKIMKVACMT